MFAADIFEHKDQFSNELGSFDVFVKNIQQWGFHPDSLDPSKKLYIWTDSSVYLSKELFLSWDLPSFRLLSIDGSHQYPIVLNDIIKAVCLLRAGGIISIDDLPSWPGVSAAVRYFFALFGTNVVRPLLLVSNKLYLCTSEEGASYMRYIRNHIAPTVGLKERIVQIIDKKYRYFAQSAVGFPPNRFVKI